MEDAYHNIAGIYDRLFDSMNKGLRLAGIRMFRPSKGMNILDVGCGTGSHLELYQRYDCNLYGLDMSPAMLEIARVRLGDSARLDLGDASAMPYENEKFNVVICMLSLHEMGDEMRSAVIEEIKRVLIKEGHLLLIDFQPGPYQPLQGWFSKVIIFFSELAAGRRHFQNYRHFLSHGGLTSITTSHDLSVENTRILAGGTFIVCLAGKNTK